MHNIPREHSKYYVSLLFECKFWITMVEPNNSAHERSEAHLGYMFLVAAPKSFERSFHILTAFHIMSVRPAFHRGERPLFLRLPDSYRGSHVLVPDCMQAGDGSRLLHIWFSWSSPWSSLPPLRGGEAAGGILH